MPKNIILLIEDEPELALLTKKTLELNNWECIVCNTLQKVLNLLETEYNNIACFLIDIMIPGNLILDVLRELRKVERYRNIPVFNIHSIKDKDFLIAKTRVGISPKDFAFNNSEAIHTAKDLLDFLKKRAVNPHKESKNKHSNKLGTTKDLIDFLKKKWEEQEKETKDDEDDFD